jgi:hypothetical protein
MNRAYLAGLAVLAFAGLVPAEAAELRDAQGRFTLTVPDGWTSDIPANAADFTVVLSKGDAEGAPGAACIGLYLDMPTTRSATQADLNTVVEGQLTADFWKSAIQASGDTSFKVISTGKRDRDGRRIHNVVFTGTVVENGKTESGKGKMEVHFIPGSMHSVMCVTDEAAFVRHTNAFETIFTSYQPSVAPLIAQARSGTASALTLFARTAQAGQAQVVSPDTPDTRRAGFNPAAGSLTVDGSGAWQVCSGAGYTGQCETVSGPIAAPFAVLSARRTGDDTPVGAAARVLRTGWGKVRTGLQAP